jgi:hypothetical protein
MMCILSSLYYIKLQKLHQSSHNQQFIHDRIRFKLNGIQFMGSYIQAVHEILRRLRTDNGQQAENDVIHGYKMHFVLR